MRNIYSEEYKELEYVCYMRIEKMKIVGTLEKRVGSENHQVYLK